ncbi:MAG TPA: sigma-70 family RNA polymerase sigma factor [Vicinamibacteria bacterium]|jgi:RNA polymerase sigma factor (TIGR02999 family)
MPEGSGGADITRLLREWQGGSAQALERLLPLVYNELHLLASRYLSRERSHHTLQTTALVNEAYLKISAQRQVDWQNRAHFFGIAAQLMRRILVDHARRDGRVKRGGRALHLSLDDVDLPSAASPVDAVDVYALDEALSRLEARDPQQGRVVELRFFGGLTIEEAAEVMGISSATVKREWAVAKAWLYRELSRDTPPVAGG